VNSSEDLIIAHTNLREIKNGQYLLKNILSIKDIKFTKVLKRRYDRNKENVPRVSHKMNYPNVVRTIREPLWLVHAATRRHKSDIYRMPTQQSTNTNSISIIAFGYCVDACAICENRNISPFAASRY